MDPAEEPPSLLWGLDPIFSAFARLYVRDILQMTESTQVPGKLTTPIETQQYACSLLFNLHKLPEYLTNS